MHDAFGSPGRAGGRPRPRGRDLDFSRQSRQASPSHLESIKSATFSAVSCYF